MSKITSTPKKTYGYKLYFDKESGTWKYEDFLSEVQHVPCDSPTGWNADLEYVKFYVDTYNNSDDKGGVKICRDCGEPFVITFGEEDWLKERGLKPFTRCFVCRKKRKKRKNEMNKPEEIVFFENYTNAVAVFSEMRIHLYRKNRVSVKDFYEFSGLPANDEDEEYGWTDLEGVRVLEHQPEGYYIDLPKPKLLEPIATAK